MLHVLRFEIRLRLGRPSTYISFAILFALAAFIVGSPELRRESFELPINSPMVVVVLTCVWCLMGGLMAAGIVGTAVERDFEHGSHELFFTTGLSKAGYLWGRFLGSFVIALVVFSGALLGTMAGAAVPSTRPEEVGPFIPAAYAQAFLMFMAPNLFLMSALFFVAGALTRSVRAVYVQGVLLIGCYVMALALMQDLDNRWYGALLDPMGVIATRYETRYWTPLETQSSLMPLTGVLMFNRLLWLGIGVAVLAVGCRLFRFSSALEGIRLRPGRATERTEVAAPDRHADPLVLLEADAGPAVERAQIARLVRLYIRELALSPAFLITLLLGCAMFLTETVNADLIFGTRVYPVTRIIVGSAEGSFGIVFLLLSTAYAGELIWKERVLRLEQIQDTLPVRTRAFYLAKLGALVGMQALLLLFLSLVGMALQASKGYFRFEPGLYFAYLFGTSFPMLVGLTVASMAVHSWVNHRFLGNLALAGLAMIFLILAQLGLDHNLLGYWSLPTVQYSDMNGFGPFTAPMFWLSLYWSAISSLVAIGTLLVWRRGVESISPSRIARSRWSRAHARAVAVAGGTALLLGGYIFYNTNVLNPYLSENANEELSARYEKRYRSYEDRPLPRIQAVKVRVDLFPERRQFRTTGTYLLRNLTGKPLQVIPVNLSEPLKVHRLVFDRPFTAELTDRTVGFDVYRLNKPLAPGDTVTLTFDLAYERRGFTHDHPRTDIAGNGTFIQGQLPSIGYVAEGELTDPDDREEHGLPPRRKRPALTDAKSRRNSYLAADADWVTFDATVSTSPDQIALAPGYLQKEWREKGRRVFHYQMDVPVLNFFSFLSARYQVRRDRWKNVDIEVYYDAKHPYNVDRMIRGVKSALDYCTRNFGPYQHRQLRIVEFPAYATFAQSFPGTIPYSEGIGFIARVDDAIGDVDYPYYITAHEVAHQWWAHQVVPANAEGAEVLSESLAEYTALMVVEERYGKSRTRKLLRYMLDQYLQGRGGEQDEEKALVYVQQQPHIHYQKGALAFYTLRDTLGEATLNKALAGFLREWRLKGPPYPTSEDLMLALYAATPPEQMSLVEDLFERITLFSIGVQTAHYRKQANGSYEVTLSVNAEKRYADGDGRESEVKLDDTVDIGLFAAPRPGEDLGRPLLVKRKRLTQPFTVVTYTVPELPHTAAIDPYSKMVDRYPEDNTRRVEAEQE